MRTVILSGMTYFICPKIIVYFCISKILILNGRKMNIMKASFSFSENNPWWTWRLTFCFLMHGIAEPSCSLKKTSRINVQEFQLQ